MELTEKYEQKLKKVLPEKRYIHSAGVSAEAKKLAKRYGADADKAAVAGILHDCAKGYKIDEQFELCRKYKISLLESDIKCPAVIHAILGAELAKRIYGIDDDEILSAIKYHTVGKADMSLLEKIIYLADMIEPNRDYKGVKKLRKLAYKDIDEALKECMAITIRFNVKKRAVIHSGTIDAWNYLNEKRNLS